jgi:hypothetical protein
MQTERLVAVEIPNSRYVVRVKSGPRLGTIFSTGDGWCYQFDGSDSEGPPCSDAEAALGAMEAVVHESRVLAALS